MDGEGVEPPERYAGGLQPLDLADGHAHPKSPRRDTGVITEYAYPWPRPPFPRLERRGHGTPGGTRTRTSRNDGGKSLPGKELPGKEPPGKGTGRLGFAHRPTRRRCCPWETDACCTTLALPPGLVWRVKPSVDASRCRGGDRRSRPHASILRAPERGDKPNSGSKRIPKRFHSYHAPELDAPVDFLIQ